jgi:hypothetical protein
VVPDLAVAEHQIEIWCSHLRSLLCLVNDAVNVLPCSSWSYLNGGPFLLRGRPRSVTSQATELHKCKIGITPFDCPVITNLRCFSRMRLAFRLPTDYGSGGWGFESLAARTSSPGQTPNRGLTARLAEATVNDLPDSRLRRGCTPLATYPGPSNQRNRHADPHAGAPVACPHCAGPAALSGIPSQPIRPAAGFLSCSTCSGWAMTRQPASPAALGEWCDRAGWCASPN